MIIEFMPLSQLTRQAEFFAAHRYFRPEWSMQENTAAFGSCVNTHGHNYQVEVSVCGDIHPDTGMLINLVELDALLQQDIISVYDHQALDQTHAAFAHNIPTLENITLDVGYRLRNRFDAYPGMTFATVRVIEHNGLYAQLEGYNPMAVTLSKKYVFSAAHQLWNGALSEEENHRCFGQCVRLHGHNYTLWVTVEGPIDEKTGMLIDLGWLDKVVTEHIVKEVDHQFLDQDVPWISGTLSTVENLATLFLDRLAPQFEGNRARLRSVKLAESEVSWAEAVPS
jgi:6-pyruvoyltetrahydropterin/6-carboxytetrahydropterin synthase